MQIIPHPAVCTDLQTQGIFLFSEPKDAITFLEKTKEKVWQWDQINYRYIFFLSNLIKCVNTCDAGEKQRRSRHPLQDVHRQPEAGNQRPSCHKGQSCSLFTACCCCEIMNLSAQNKQQRCISSHSDVVWKFPFIISRCIFVRFITG